ncbi:hypothetical protein C8Q80DRAFT_246167 [Daedaleopsis nitida]|nr:hypothetical protein C8Q80DRAFT_246167 [Daedaleopsis nitida]
MNPLDFEDSVFDMGVALMVVVHLAGYGRAYILICTCPRGEEAAAQARLPPGDTCSNSSTGRALERQPAIPPPSDFADHGLAIQFLSSLFPYVLFKVSSRNIFLKRLSLLITIWGIILWLAWPLGRTHERSPCVVF